MVMKPGTVGQDSAACEKRRDSGWGERSTNPPPPLLPLQPVDTMLSLQDSVFFEISIKSLLKSWSSSCKYTCLSGRNAEAWSVPFLAC